MNIKTVGLIAALALVATGAQANYGKDSHSYGYKSKVKVSCTISKPSYGDYSKKRDYKKYGDYKKYYGHKKYSDYKKRSEYKKRKHVVRRCDRYWS
ncbi:hypothetical protein [Photobacterium atrarenae]|uniref:Uncharacterized protein n=1 Tax=Photobacterium atrarenae TaxID=865757 RepID=A0ABY5GM74_9GAMM|nr:hypothetical protein [Photobacterium atrarenae]UTV30256.1 hypothetical protein NNL38_16890 [Photobacterium atrarenae]